MVKTQLKNRVLWFDGTSQVDPELVPNLFLQGIAPEKVVCSLNDDIELFNSIADVPISAEKTENALLSKEYQIPSSYKELDLARFIGDMQFEHCYAHGKDHSIYQERVEAEMREIQARKMELLFKTLIYVVDRFKETGTVWGVGRGSSCASLILYLIGLHSVDPVRYGIPMEEFFH